MRQMIQIRVKFVDIFSHHDRPKSVLFNTTRYRFTANEFCDTVREGVHLGFSPGTAQDETFPRATRVGDKAVIRSSVALRAPPSGTTPSASSVGVLMFAGPYVSITELPAVQ